MDLSRASQELEFFNRFIGEWSDLSRGDRVMLLTAEGEFHGTVFCDWTPARWPSPWLKVSLDCNPEIPVEFHRAMFRAYTALDHIASS